MVAIYQDRKADEATQELQGLRQLRVIVKRNGVWKYLKASELVPGDLIQLRPGNKVYADCKLVLMKSVVIMVSQAALTGVKKDVPKEVSEEKSENELSSLSMIFEGSIVRTGYGHAIVCRTGESCLINRLIKEKTEQDSTTLEKKLDSFGKFLEIAVFYICVLIWVMNFTNFRDPLLGGFINGSIYYFKIAVALAVAALPEGLPTVITACLSLGTRRLTKRKSIVQKLSSVETLGSTTVICTSTAGLTAKKMKVSDFMLFGRSPSKLLKFSVNPKSGEFVNLADQVADLKCIRQFIQGLFINNSQKWSPDKDDPEDKEFIDSSFESAIYPFVSNFYFLSEELKTPTDYLQYLTDKWSVKTNLTYDSMRRTSSTLARAFNKDTNYLFIKGEPKSLLAISKRALLSDTGLEILTEEDKLRIMGEVRKMASKGLKVMGVAYKKEVGELSRFEGPQDKTKPATMGMLKDPFNYKTIEEDCDLIGFIGISDPIRDEIKKAVKTCTNAGILTFLVSSNLQEAAEAISKEMGLDASACISSSLLDSSSHKDLVATLKEAIKTKRNLVFSSVSENQKRRLVKTLQSLGQVVLVTGKDSSDEPALAQADIPVVMGVCGTDGAKDIASLILSEDNFACIVDAIEEGRGIYENMKAFIRYMISSNIGEVFGVFLFSLLGLPDGFNSIQLLWVNLVTDGFPAMALSFNPSDEDIMLKPPRSKDDGIVNAWVLIRYFSIGIYIGLATVGIFVYWYVYYTWANDGHPLVTLAQLRRWSECPRWKDFRLNSYGKFDFENKNPCIYFTKGKAKACTLSLTLIIVIELFNCWNAVSDKNSLFKTGLTTNRYLLPVTLGCLGAHILMLYFPGSGILFGVEALDWKDWFLVLVFALPVILIEELLKYISKLREKGLISSSTNSPLTPRFKISAKPTDDTSRNKPKESHSIQQSIVDPTVKSESPKKATKPGKDWSITRLKLPETPPLESREGSIHKYKND